MNTTDIMDLALKMSGFDKVPGDSEIFNHGENIRRILFGIDIGDDDVIRAKDSGMDLVISHHPPNNIPGKRFVEVIDRHVEFMVKAGVPIDVAREAVIPVKERFKFNPLRTHDDIIALSRRLNIALMNIHQPCDEMGRRILQCVMDKAGKVGTIRELISSYNALDEFSRAGRPVELICGSPDAVIGNGIVIHGAGTNGGHTVADALFTYGMNTVVYIHVLPHQNADRQRLMKENKGNLLATGHFPSDALGINPLIKELELRGMEVVMCNGL
ncbi:MAG: hypothetical protein HZA16_11120 [Nitrospirae bacterium]|nr:hypothetical protein [Nitrospirota bacterium]